MTAAAHDAGPSNRRQMPNSHKTFTASSNVSRTSPPQQHQALSSLRQNRQDGGVHEDTKGSPGRKDVIGEYLSVYSKANIRYTGRVQNIDNVNFTLVLENVRCHGTEDRVSDKAHYVAPKQEIFPSIVFTASNIDHVKYNTPEDPFMLLNDPAVLNFAVSSGSLDSQKSNRKQGNVMGHYGPKSTNNRVNNRNLAKVAPKQKNPRESPISASDNSTSPKAHTSEFSNQKGYKKPKNFNRGRNNNRQYRQPKIDPVKAEELKQKLTMDINSSEKISEFAPQDGEKAQSLDYEFSHGFFDCLKAEEDNDDRLTSAEQKSQNKETFGNEIRISQRLFYARKNNFRDRNINSEKNVSTKSQKPSVNLPSSDKEKIIKKMESTTVAAPPEVTA